MNIRINFPNLITQLLPNHKRQKNRIALLRQLNEPAERMYHEFEKWRKKKRIHMNTTAQIISLEGFLNAQPGLAGTVITTYFSGGLQVGLISERYYTAKTSLNETDPGTPADPNTVASQIPTGGYYNGKFEGADFLVEIPNTNDPEENLRRRQETTRIVDRYKLALTTYTIKELTEN